MMRNEEIFAAVRASLEGRTVKNALLIPPDFTRYHSNAGLISCEYYRIRCLSIYRVIQSVPLPPAHFPSLRCQSFRCHRRRFRGHCPHRHRPGCQVFHPRCGTSGRRG